MAAIWKDLGPAEVSYKGTVLGKTAQNADGGTHGGARWRLAVESKQTYRDKSGTQPYDEIIVGTTMEVQATLTGQSVDQLAALIPGATVIGMGGNSKQLKIVGSVGTSMRDNAGELVLKPIIDGVATTDQDQWFKASLAYPRPNLEVVFDMETQRVYDVTFAVFDNLTTGILATLGKTAT